MAIPKGYWNDRVKQVTRYRTILNGAEQDVVICPWCSCTFPDLMETHSVDNHRCSQLNNEQVFFLNSHAISGVGLYNMEEKKKE